MKYWGSYIFLFLYCTALFAQEDGVNFARLSVEDGLSNNNVNCIFQDSKGFVWMGTQDGLNRFDGYEFTHFKHNPKDTKSISSNVIWAIHEDKLGNLWIGTQDGLNRFDHKTHTFLVYKHHQDSLNSLLNNKVYSILEDKKGYLWVGTEEGVSRLDRRRSGFTHFRFPSFFDTEDNTTVKTILEDKAGNILVGTYGGGLLMRSENRDFKPLAVYPDSLKTEFIQSIFQDAKGNYWVGTMKGIRKIDTQNRFSTFTPYPQSVNDKDFNHIIAINEDKKGNIWAGTVGGGVVVITPTSPTNQYKSIIYTNTFKNPQSLSRDLINHIFVDKTGIIWIATEGGGISMYDEGRDKFEHFSYQIGVSNSLTNNTITSFYEDRNGILWIGTGGGGLNRYDKKTRLFSSFQNNPNNKKSLSDNYVTCIFPSKLGGLWLGTSSGLNYFDTQKSVFQIFKKDFKKQEWLEDDHIISLFEDKEGVLWIGTYEGGLNRYDTKDQKFKAFQNIAEFAEHTLSDNMVQAITEDKEGFLWIGTGGGGLNRFDKNEEKFVVFKNRPEDSLSLAHNSVKCIYEDTKGTIWIGTHGGLDKFDRTTGTFVNYNKKNGLPSNTIHGILEDNKGYLWLSTNAGISHFWRKENQSITNEFHNYDQFDNLQSNEFNTGAFFKNKEGKMFFGGHRGFNAFYPDSVENNIYKPNVYFTHFRINGKNVSRKTINSPLEADISETKKIILTHEQNTFSFDFVALNYRHSEKNEYQWKLEGHDSDWTKPSKQRTVTYTNLAAGSYTLLVRASNNDGVWNDQAIDIEIEVLKAIWDTWWFRILIGFVIAGLIFGVYKARVYQIQQLNKRLERQVQERTIQISKQKDEILLINNELQGKQAEILAQQQEIVAKNQFLETANQEISQRQAQLQKSYSDIQVISDIGQRITSLSHHQDFLAETVFDKIANLVAVDMFRIGILDKETKKIVFQGFSGKEKISTYYHDFSTREGQHLSLWCIENKKEIFINDFDKEYQNYIKNGKINTSIKNRPQSVIYLPLIVENDCIGVMTVQSYKKNAYTHENLNILKTLSTFTSIAVDNYRTHTDLEEAKKEIEHNNQKTEDSIRYAETIQKAILPDDHFLKNALGEYFIIFEPQAIVSGDFYWCKQVKNKVFLAVVDCTGHGVPGAFMSIIGSTVMNDIVVQQKIHEPAQILEELHFGIRSALRQENRINDDGMDVCLCVLEKIEDKKGKSYTKLTFSGAKRPLYYVIDGKLETLQANKRSIGGGRNVVQKPFEQETLHLPQGAMIYLCSDGYADQNNPEKEKIGSMQLKEWLQTLAHEPLAVQDIRLLTNLITHMVDEDAQRDDITLIGVRM
jgi:ligand-binding sensor domain-containing protein/serine phosphatase RsbU (regulator of sigma subunit)/putative methionine-R-sulfoxide reductase with GAF domain